MEFHPEQGWGELHFARGRSALSKFFIAAGILVILVLFTALIGPHFVDWTSYRESFEREASAYIGRPVTVMGKADVRLLPTPAVSFTDIRVGDAEAPDVEMEQFRAEIDLAPLLKGEVRVLQMTVERPRVPFRPRAASQRMAILKLYRVAGGSTRSGSRSTGCR